MQKGPRLVMFCRDCGKNFVMKRENFDGTCPMCGTFITRFRCSRCAHEWTPREWGRLPQVCPKCKSPYWCRERSRQGDYESGGIAGEKE